MNLPGLDLEALRAYLGACDVEPAGPLRAELVAGGRSNLTYRVTDGVARWVVRRPPLAGLTASAHDMAREWRVTSALLATDVPIARPVIVCENERVLGAPFTVAEWVDGIMVRDRADLDVLSDKQVRVTTEAGGGARGPARRGHRRGGADRLRSPRRIPCPAGRAVAPAVGTRADPGSPSPRAAAGPPGRDGSGLLLSRRRARGLPDRQCHTRPQRSGHRARRRRLGTVHAR